jgi:uncharacterized protein (DUF1330 family)
VSAYVLVEIEVTDPEAYAEYGKLAFPNVERHGGRFLVRGGATEMLEGDWAPRIVLLEFESLDAIQRWYHSDDYQAILPMRLNSTKSRLIAVDGVAT